MSIEPRFRTIDGLKIRYAESAPREVDALLLNPWPESLFAYAQIWSRLAEHAHLVAIDLPGFGHSEGRTDLMSPRAMSDFVVRVADAFGLVKPHAVGPDIGTATLLFAAAANPGRLRSVVVGSGGAAYPLQLAGPLLDWVAAPDVERFRRADPREIVGSTLATIAGYAMPDAIRQDYVTGYAGDRFVESMSYVRAYPTDLAVLRDQLAHITTPVHIISGTLDRVVPRANADYLYSRLPNSTVSFLDTGHFAWESAAAEYATVVVNWWAPLDRE
jgi:pimeloyl-ACP methyl ester carboxylesterase